MELILVEQFLRLLPEAAFVLAPDGRVLLANSAASALTGRAKAGVAGGGFDALVSDPPERVADFLRLCARSRQLMPGAFDWKLADGSSLRVRCDGALLAVRSGSVPAMLFVRCRPRDEATEHFSLLNRKVADLSREILERKKAERERDELLERERAARREAEGASRMKDEFLATVSHELRAPLNAVVGWTAVLQRAGLPPEQFARALTTIERNARAQAQIVDDLLDMSAIVSGRVRLNIQNVALAPILDGVVESLRPAAEAKRIRVQTLYDPLAAPIKGDPARLQQVVWNLLSNAIKFTPKDGRVQVFLERVNSHLELAISDNGEGIHPHFLPHVFERFRQADGSTTRVHQGLGLGLAIVKHLVELHGGTVRAKSRGEGHGSTFTVLLPVPIVQQPRPDATDVGVHPTTDTGSGSKDSPVRLDGLRILVVDDDADSRDLVRHLLQAAGAEVAVAASAGAGLEALERHGADLIVSDIGMPEVDGYAFMRAVRAGETSRSSRIAAVALTAFARSSDRTSAMKAGFNAHLAKPVDPVELIATLASLARLIE